MGKKNPPEYPLIKPLIDQDNALKIYFAELLRKAADDLESDVHSDCNPSGTQKSDSDVLPESPNT